MAQSNLSSGESVGPVSQMDMRTAVDRLASTVVARGLAVPAIFVFEMYRPCVVVSHSISLFAAPLMIPILGADRYRFALQYLESREFVEQLIQRIEERSRVET